MASAPQLFIFTLGLLAGTIHLSTQDDGCVPGTVQNLTLTGNGTLHWETPDTEQCSIASYLVHVTLLNGTVQWSYTTEDTSVDVGHLESCESYTFRVFQLSTDNVTGSGWAIYAITPPPSEANLELAYLNHFQVARIVRLEWALEQQYARCARRYRVVVYSDDSDFVFDEYTTLTAINIGNVIPCSHYTFSVRALFTLEQEGPATMLQHTTFDAVTTPPELISVTPARNSVTFVWNLQEYSGNRCAISALRLDGSPNFNFTQAISDQTNRNPISITVNNLAAASLYYLRASVINTAGESSPFLMAVQTLE